MVLFAGLSGVILAFTIFVVIESRDLTALLVGLLIVFILYSITIVFRPPVSQLPGTRLP